MQTPITEMFGVEFPIFAFTHCRDVVVAVSKAGGLGVLGAVAHSNEGLEVDLQWIQDELGGRPFGVDLIVPAKYAGDQDGGLSLADVVAMIPAEHQDFLQDLLERYDVPQDDQATPGWATRSETAPFSASRADQQLEIALAHPPALIVNALGPTPDSMIE
ncbi:MAG: nitronate monooxygenase, partial [Acidimicrobiales bacterium]